MSFPPETNEPVLPESEALPEEEGPVSEGKIIAPVLRERPATLDKVKSSPTIITGLVILIIIALIFAVRSVGGLLGGGSASPSPSGSSAHPSAVAGATLPPDQGISFSPKIVSCAVPTIFTMTVTLPATIKPTDTVVEKLDDKTLGSFTLADMGFTQQANGGWNGSFPSTVASMQATCANKGVNTGGQAVLTTGNHSLGFFDSQGNLLARGYYTVTTGPLTYPSTLPSASPTQVANTGSNKITFAPVSLNCATPTAFTTTITLSSTLSAVDVITENFNGLVVSSFVVGQVMNQLNDGSWTGTNTIPVEQVTQICAAGGKYNGVAVFAPGTNDLQLLNSQGKQVADNFYTVK
jgi:hypothetical protein